MADSLIPLSRRSYWWLVLLVPLGLAGFLAFIITLLSAAPFQGLMRWLPALYLLVLAGAAYWNFVAVTRADYDANYLYLLRTVAPQPVPLGSICELWATRGQWHLCYRDEQQQKREVLLAPRYTGWSARNSSIHGFIAAVRQHNPNLDVRHGLFQ